MTSTDSTEGTVAPAVVTFTASNWHTAQTVTVTGKDDNVDDGDVSFAIRAVATSNDPAYDGMTAPDVTVTNLDDEGDIRVLGATADGETTLAVTYEIDGVGMASFDVGVFLSNDGHLDPSDLQIAVATVSEAGELSAGLHTKTFAIGSGPGQIGLPGAGAAETDDDYYVLVVADPTDLVDEGDAHAFDEDNTQPLIGAYHPAGGDVYLHGTEGDDEISVSSGSLRVVINGDSFVFELATTTGLRVRGHGGDDQLSFDAGDGFATAPPLQLYIHGGAGNNRLTLRGSTGDDVLKLHPARAEMSGPGYDLRSAATGQIYAYATAGGNDEALLYDSLSDDTFTADGEANGVRLEGPGFDNYAEGFDWTYAYATNGIDTARLYDSAG